MKYYLIAGEASGDLHGSNLVKALHHLDPHASIRAWGGDRMQAAGAEVVKHFRDLAFMGFVEVISNLPTIMANLRFCKQDILSFQPDVLVLIDYPGFNLRIAEWAKKHNIKVAYYISPQVWAWKEGRVKKIKQVVDKMLVILPFEEAFYEKWNYKVVYVGHPLVQAVESFKANHNPKPAGGKTIALLPGSRKQEIRKKLPVMLTAAKHFPEYQFVVAQAPSLEDDFYRSFLAPYPNVSVVRDQTYALLSEASAALVTSGTATLETALFGVPEVVCYKGNPVSYAIARRLIKIKYISLVNLIMDRMVVKELIQHELNEASLVKELGLLLRDEAVQQRLLKDYAELWQKLRQEDTASSRAAAEIIALAGPSS